MFPSPSAFQGWVWDNHEIDWCNEAASDSGERPCEGRGRARDPIFAQGGSDKKFDDTEHPCLAVGMNSMCISLRESLDGQGSCKYRTVFDCCRVNPSWWVSF